MSSTSIGERLLQRIRAISSSISSLSLREYQRDRENDTKPNTSSLFFRLADVFTRTWDLGFTAFGGPPVHFGILHQRFVEENGGKATWFDEQTYQELFAVCQALPGPASTKMLFCMVLLHAGLTPAIFAFLLWSLPGAIGMFLLALGVGNIKEVLPGPVYAMLSGLNAATVGIIALAAFQLASKAITDRVTRILVIGGACAGLCYTALWYFPMLMAVGGLSTVLWDIYISRFIGKLRARIAQRRRNEQRQVEETSASFSIPLEDIQQSDPSSSVRPRVPGVDQKSQPEAETMSVTARVASQPQDDSPKKAHSISVWLGLTIGATFFASFAAVLVCRGVISMPRPLPLDLFSNMYLAGTIIFGGGPVVIPLLREYVVQPGWVSSRDFLIGLAIIQAFPGPNFNFAVYLSALAIRASTTQYSMVFGAILGYVGIFAPGLTLALAVQGVWRVLRTKSAVVSLLRGVNAAAVGLVFTAVYRLWEIGYLTPLSSQGGTLATEPWWVVVAAVTYSSSAWFGVPSALAIVAGAVLGLLWYVAVGHNIFQTSL